MGDNEHLDPSSLCFPPSFHPQGFARLSFSRMLGVVTMVFVKRPLLCYITNVETSTTKTGMAGLFGNKGSSSVRFSLSGMSVCFSNCHLVPHVENLERRLQELNDIFVSEVFDTARLPLCRPLDHDVLVLFGDLNFRLEGCDFDQALCWQRQGELNQLLRHDQLLLEQEKGETDSSCLNLFMEMPIEFPPSYKYKPGSDEFCDGDGGKVRCPAWCDRVLWRTHERTLPDITAANPRPLVTQQFYSVHMQPRLSDHKAVSAGLQLSVDLGHFSPPVVFHLTEWITGQQGTIAFDVAPATDVSLWDWVGLYREHFSSVERDYVFWIYTPAARGKAKRERFYSRKLRPEQVPAMPGTYILLYQSSQYGAVIGMSPIFRIAALE